MNFCSTTIKTALQSFGVLIILLSLSGCGGGAGSSALDSTAPPAEKPDNGASSKTNPSSAASSTANSQDPIQNSSSSSSKSSAGLDTVPPTAPANFWVPNTYSNKVVISWSPAVDNREVILYRIYKNNTLFVTTDGGYDTYVDFKVEANKSYSYGISAGDDAGNWSPIITLSTQTLAMESSSSTSAPAHSSSSISSSNPSSSSPSTSSAVATSASVASSSVVASSAATSSSSSNSSSAATSSAISSSNSSLISSSAASIAISKPTPPTLATIISATANKVDISWSAAAVGDGVTAYQIHRDGNLIATLAANTLTYSDTSVVQAQTYVYGISAGNANGWSADTNISVTTPTQTVSGSVTLSWLTPIARDDGSSMQITEIGGYAIRYAPKSSTNFTYITITDNLANSYIFQNLSGSYDFQIAAFDTNQIYSQFITLSPK